MKIGFFTDCYLPNMSGVEVSIETFRKELEKMGHQVFVYAPHMPGYRDKNSRVFRLKSIRFIKEPEMRFAFPLASDGHIRELVRFKLDVVHVHTPFSMGFLGKFISSQQKIPIVYTHHTDYPSYTKVYLKEKLILPFLAQSFSAWFSNISDAVIAPSSKIKKSLEAGDVKKPIFILPTGVDLELFRKTKILQGAAQMLRARFNIGSDTKILLYVGRMGKEKNIDFLIKSFGEISKLRNDVVLLLVGGGPMLKKFQALTKSLKLSNVLFVGPIVHEDLPAYYRAADVFVFSSLTDTQGIVILEAMSSSLPVVALQDDALEGIFIENRNGFLVNPSASPRVFGAKVTELLEDEQLHSLFSSGSLEIAQRFSKEAQARKLVDIYKKIRGMV